MADCDERYNTCVVSAFALATLEHIACTSIDVTVVGGILWHGAVTVMHYTAQDECNYDREDCRDNQS